MTTESQQQITQARKELRKLFGEWWVNGKLSYLYKPEDSETVLAIILSAIERATELATEAVNDWKAGKLNDGSAMMVMSMIFTPLKPTDVDIARAREIAATLEAAQPQRGEPHQHVFNQDGGACHTCGLTYTQIIQEHQSPQRSKQQESANVHIEHYFPKGYDPDKEPWCSIRKHHKAALHAVSGQVAAESKLRNKWLTTCANLAELLAAERKENKQLRDQINSFQGQLAAEREHRKLVDNVLDNRCLQLRKMEDEIAAERQCREQAEVEIDTQAKTVFDALVRVTQLEHQLLSALAAIEEHNKLHTLDYPKHTINDIDLSALLKHDAELKLKIWREAPDQPDIQESVIARLDLVHRHAIEKAVAKVREPLVKALKKAREVIYALHGDVAWEIYEKHSPEMKMIDDALVPLGGMNEGKNDPKQ